MATSKKAPQGVWKTKTISEFKVDGTAAVWRAQISKSPDGKQFAGIRKYFVKKDGAERADRAGLSILINEENTASTISQVKQLASLFKSLHAALDSQSPTVEVAERAPKKGNKPPIQEEAFALFKGDDFLVKCVKNATTGKTVASTTRDANEARTWATETEAVAYLTGRPNSLHGFDSCLIC